MARKLALLSLSSFLAACSSADAGDPPIDGTYVGGTQTEAVIVRLAGNPDGTISGNVGMAKLDYETGKIDVTSKSLSGRAGDGQVFITMHGNSLGAEETPLNAELTDNDLLVRAPGGTAALKLSRGAQQDYDKRVATLVSNLNANDVGLVPEDQ